MSGNHIYHKIDLFDEETEQSLQRPIKYAMFMPSDKEIELKLNELWKGPNIVFM